MSLKVNMDVVNSIIEQFNHVIWDNRVPLKNWGQDIDEDNMARCLLQAYHVAQDSKFNDYVMLL